MKNRIGRGLVVACLGVVTLLMPLLVSSHRIDEAHRNLILDGMTVAEVEDIFGAPAGVYDWAVVDESLSVKYATYRALIYLARMQEAEAANQEQIRYYAPARALKLKLRRLALEGTTNKTWTSRHGSVTVSFDHDGRVVLVGDWMTTHLEPPWKKWWDKIKGK